MPVYEYKCECGNIFEKNVPLAEYKEPQPCPECGKLCEKQVTCALLKNVG